MARRIRFAVSFGLVLILVGGGFLATRGYDASGLAEVALDHAREATGVRLEAHGARFSLLRGLELEDVHADAPFPGGRYEVALREILLEHRLSALLRGRVDVEGVVLAQPRVVLTLGAKPRLPSAPSPERAGDVEPSPQPAPELAPVEEPSSSKRLRFSLSEIRVEDGSFAIRDRSESPERLGIEGLDLELDAARFDRGALTLLHGIAGKGRLAMDALRFARTEVTGLEARVEAEAGRYALSELALETAGARFESSRVELDFNTIPFRYRLGLEGRGELPGVLGGGGSLRLDATGFGTSARALSGEGALRLAAAALPDAPWVRSLEASSGFDLVGRSYAASRLSFRVESSRIVFEPFRLEAASYLIEAEGAVELDGAIDFRLAVAEDASAERRFRLSGTFAAPTVEALH